MGSSTTQAVAQKLGRKWLGIEMGDHFSYYCSSTYEKSPCRRSIGYFKGS